MATLTDLRDRIIRETNRDELLDAPSPDNQMDANSAVLDLCIQRAVEDYANQRFAFNETTEVLAITNEYEDLPEGLRSIDQILLHQGSGRYSLCKQDYRLIELWQQDGDIDPEDGVITGQPTDYAISDGQIRFYPAPNGSVYNVSVQGVKDAAALNYDDPTSQNEWTNEGQDLIAARARYLLMRDYFRDSEGAQIAAFAEQDAVSRLRARAVQQLGTGRLRGSW
jgi:hypothetical protein